MTTDTKQTDTLKMLEQLVTHNAEQMFRSDELLPLIMEMREQMEALKANRDSADVDFAALSKAIATNSPLPECRSAGGIVILTEIKRLRALKEPVQT